QFDCAQSRAQRRRNIVQKGKTVMQVTTERPDQAALTIDKSASVLGIHEFSLLSRIQAGEINSTRARSGEMAIPESALDRLAPNVNTAPRVDLETGPVPVSDEKMGIKKAFGGLRQHGEYPARF